jgi:hypothetical protein
MIKVFVSKSHSVLTRVVKRTVRVMVHVFN